MLAKREKKWRRHNTRVPEKNLADEVSQTNSWLQCRYLCWCSYHCLSKMVHMVLKPKDGIFWPRDGRNLTGSNTAHIYTALYNPKLYRRAGGAWLKEAGSLLKDQAAAAAHRATEAADFYGCAGWAKGGNLHGPGHISKAPFPCDDQLILDATEFSWIWCCSP